MAARGIVIIMFLSLINTAIFFDENWTVFVFAQLWPPNMCQTRQCDPIPKEVKTWTIHGLWPNRGNISVHNCNKSWPFRRYKIKSLEKQLEASWPSLSRPHNETGWLCRTMLRYGVQRKHEWEKHGTCATNLKATNSEFRYFNMSLSLNNVAAFNPQRALETAGITPSCTKAYPIEVIEKAVKKYFQMNTNQMMMLCGRQWPETKANRTLLVAIYIALSKSFKKTTLPYPDKQSCKPGDKLYILPFREYCPE